MYESLSSSTWVNCWARTVADGHSSVMSTWKTRLTVPFRSKCQRDRGRQWNRASGALPPFNGVGVWKRAMKGRRVWPDSLDGIHDGRQKAETGGSHTRAPSPFPFQFSRCRLLPGQIQPPSSYLRGGRGLQVVSGRPTSRRSRPPLSLSSIKIRHKGEPWVGRCRFKALCLRQRFRGGKRKRFLMLFLQSDSRVGRRAIDHQVYIGLLCAGWMFSSRGDVEGLWRVY